LEFLSRNWLKYIVYALCSAVSERSSCEKKLEVIKSLTFTANLVQALYAHLCARAGSLPTHTQSANSKGRLLHWQVPASAVAAHQLAQAEDFFLLFVFQMRKKQQGS